MRSERILRIHAQAHPLLAVSFSEVHKNNIRARLLKTPQRNIQRFTKGKEMKDISKMEMAKTVFGHPSIKVEKAFFGLKTKVTYTKTNCAVKGLCLEYTLDDGKKIIDFLNAEEGSIDDAVQKIGKLSTSDYGSLRLALCYSEDKRFAALQLYKYQNFSYITDGKVWIYEGDDAEKHLRPFIK